MLARVSECLIGWIGYVPDEHTVFLGGLRQGGSEFWSDACF